MNNLKEFVHALAVYTYRSLGALQALTSRVKRILAMPRFRKRLFRQPLPKWVAGWDWMVSCRPGGRRKRAPYSAVIRVNVMGLKINLIPVPGLGSWSRRSVSGALPFKLDFEHKLGLFAAAAVVTFLLIIALVGCLRTYSTC